MQSKKCPNPTNLIQIWLKTHYFDSKLWVQGTFLTPCVRALTTHFRGCWYIYVPPLGDGNRWVFPLIHETTSVVEAALCGTWHRSTAVLYFWMESLWTRTGIAAEWGSTAEKKEKKRTIINNFFFQFLSSMCIFSTSKRRFLKISFHDSPESIVANWSNCRIKWRKEILLTLGPTNQFYI